jgi:hypothetical protein
MHAAATLAGGKRHASRSVLTVVHCSQGVSGTTGGCAPATRVDRRPPGTGERARESQRCGTAPAPRGAIKVAACVRRVRAAEAAHRPVLECAVVTRQGVDVPSGMTVETEAKEFLATALTVCIAEKGTLSERSWRCLTNYSFCETGTPHEWARSRVNGPFVCQQLWLFELVHTA